MLLSPLFLSGMMLGAKALTIGVNTAVVVLSIAYDLNEVRTPNQVGKEPKDVKFDL